MGENWLLSLLITCMVCYESSISVNNSFISQIAILYSVTEEVWDSFLVSMTANFSHIC